MGPFREMVMNVGSWMELAQDRVHLQDFVLTELNLSIVLPESSCHSPSGKLLKPQES
jgi:hypothetical protein